MSLPWLLPYWEHACGHAHGHGNMPTRACLGLGYLPIGELFSQIRVFSSGDCLGLGSMPSVAALAFTAYLWGLHWLWLHALAIGVLS